MAVFRIKAIKPDTREAREFFYDNMTSSLIDAATGKSAVPVVEPIADRPPIEAISPERPGRKTTPRTLKISLGLSCNYECEYCSQRFVPRNVETNPDDIAAFVAGLDEWVTTPPERIEFWGGEPLVYIKTLRPLAERLRSKYPEARLSIITNGSLLNAEINEWLDALGFSVGISHDGPGQHVRGPDPLATPESREAILDLYRRLAPKGRVSFNAMLNRANTSRAAIARFFVDLTGDERVSIGEGGIVDAYDEGGLALSLEPGDFAAFRNRAFGELRSGQAANFSVAREKVASFVNSIRTARPASAVGQKCSMDRPDNIAVDLRGNVLTCQNVSAVSVAPNGESHKIGHVTDLDSVRLATARHWSTRDDCPSCPVLHICAGSCMFLEGPLWERTCDNAYSDALAYFAAGIEFLTGYVPIRIEGPHRADRHDLWSTPAPSRSTRRVIPISRVAA